MMKLYLCYEEVGRPIGSCSAVKLLALVEEFLMNQYVHVPTKGANILDLLFTNDSFLVTNVSNKLKSLRL